MVETTLISAYGLLLILSGLILLGLEIKADFRDKPGNPLPAWNENIWAFLLFFGLLLLLPMALGQLALAATDGWANHSVLEHWRTPIYGLAAQLGMLLAVLLMFHTKCRQYFLFEQGERTFAFSPSRTTPWPKLLLAGLCLMLAALPLVGAINVGWEAALTVIQDWGYDVSLEPQELLNLFSMERPGVTAMMIFLAIIVAPVVEEFVFRGVIYRYLKGRSSARIALIVSSVLFSLIHANLAVFLPLFLLGMLLCRAYEKTQNILVPIAMHACFNTTTIIGIFLIPHLERQLQ